MKPTAHLLAVLMSTILTGSVAASSLDGCRENLKNISQALKRFQTATGRLPDQLHDLHPEFLARPDVLRCPADPSPAAPVSYAYEFSADPSPGLGRPLGPFPKPDSGDGWGSQRHVGLHQRTFFGDQVPVVRCLHHQAGDAEDARVLNLTLGGRIYVSGIVWERHPDTIAAALECLERDLALSPDDFAARRYLGPFEHYLRAWMDDPGVAHLHGRFPGAAAALERFAARQPPDQRAVTLRVAARLLNGAGDHERAESVIREAIRLLDREQTGRVEVTRWGNARGEEEMLVLADALEARGRFGESIPLYEQFLRLTPGRRSLMHRLATALEASGDLARANLLWLKVDPGRALVGQDAPPFTLPTPEGGELSLEAFLRGKRAVLVNFWFLGCQPCRKEFPHLETLHRNLSRQGLGIVAVNYNDAAQPVRDFLRAQGYTLPVVLGGAGPEFIGEAYQIRVYPTNYLLDGDGRILWRGVGFDEAALRQAVTDAGFTLE
jgi:thiol-disulfide isomerase/thioredoxin